METKQYWFRIRGNVYGPFSAKEMLEHDLPDMVEVTDEYGPSEWKVRWRTAGDFDFYEIYNNSQTGENHSTNDLRMEGPSYLFYFKKDDREIGPRTAGEMLKCNLSPDTPVTEKSLNGQWFTAANFDFQKLSKEENDVQQLSRERAKKNVVYGILLIVASLVIVLIAVAIGVPAMCIGALFVLVWGLIYLLGGISGDDGWTDEERQRAYKHAYRYEEAENTSNEEFETMVDKDLTPGKIIELYAELEITPEATDGEVKKAYRAMAKRYHPDRYSSASDDERRNVTTRFRNINDAYELIKQLRNMK